MNADLRPEDKAELVRQLTRSADVALIGENLDCLPLALQHAQRARRIMVQNISLSLAIVGTLVPLALYGSSGWLRSY